MAVSFNQEVFAAFKTLSVQSSDDLKVGETYYAFFFQSVYKYTLTEILTEREGYARRGLLTNSQNADELAWVVLNNEAEGKEVTHSLQDSNIDGGGYNPYMLFRNKKIADAYASLIDVKFFVDDDDWFYD